MPLQVLFHTRLDRFAPQTRHAFVSVASELSHGGSAAAAKVASSGSIDLAAVDCEAIPSCAEWTAGGQHHTTPSIWCFPNGNWSLGPPLNFQYEFSAVASTALLDFTVKCATHAHAHQQLVEESRFRRVPPPPPPRYAILLFVGSHYHPMTVEAW